MPSPKVLRSKESLTREESIATTRSNTPESGGHERYSNETTSDKDSSGGEMSPRMRESTIQSFSSLNDPLDSNSFEIDVCPRRKKFNTPEERKLFIEEYKRKYKTELCKNWELRGYCKFGDKCCFAHGRHELKCKSLTHTKYKTKPCKQYYQTGYCPYGQRCQYLHKEALQPNILFTPNEPGPQDPYQVYESLHEINRLCGCEVGLEPILNKLPNRPRLNIFEKVSNQYALN
jgi:hypothetical protein